MSNTTAARRTLAELNAAYPRRRTWSTYELESFYAVGRLGRRQAGTKVHMLSCERVVGYVGDWTPSRGQFKMGDTFSAHAFCNGNGQQNSWVSAGADTDAITCEKCRS